MDYSRIVHEVVDELISSPIDLGDGPGLEHDYINDHINSYIRTVRDIDTLYKNERTGKNILEIGSFFGPVSITLKRLGYNVSATEIPEFYNFSSLRSLYEKNGIPFAGINLRSSKLPCQTSSLDAVIICEVMEHLNFNPLPMLNEINRVLKHGGYIYIGMPNQSTFGKRLKMLAGKSVHEPVNRFFQQLDGMTTQIIGLHWREYTLHETVELLERMGFETISKYYFTERKQSERITLLAALEKIAFFYPPFRPYQVVTGKKVTVPAYEFYLTAANT